MKPRGKTNKSSVRIRTGLADPPWQSAQPLYVLAPNPPVTLPCPYPPHPHSFWDPPRNPRALRSTAGVHFPPESVSVCLFSSCSLCPSEVLTFCPKCTWDLGKLLRCSSHSNMRSFLHSLSLVSKLHQAQCMPISATIITTTFITIIIIITSTFIITSIITTTFVITVLSSPSPSSSSPSSKNLIEHLLYLFNKHILSLNPISTYTGRYNHFPLFANQN